MYNEYYVTIHTNVFDILSLTIFYFFNNTHKLTCKQSINSKDTKIATSRKKFYFKDNNKNTQIFFFTI